MGVITQRLNKEVITLQEVEQIVAHREEFEDSFIFISSNSTDDNEKSLLNARKALDYGPIAIEVGDDDGESLTISIDAQQAFRIGKSLIAMANFLLDESKYKEVK